MAQYKVNLDKFVVLLLFFVSIILLHFIGATGVNIDERFIVLFFFLLAIVTFKRNAIHSIVYVFWMFFFSWFTSDMEPLSTPDSYKYFSEAFGGGYYRTKSFSDIIYGHVPIVEVGGLIIRSIGQLLVTTDIKLIVAFNIVLLIESSVILSRLFQERFGLSNKSALLLFVLMCISPSAVNVGLELLKDMYVFFCITVSLYLIERADYKPMSSYIAIFFIVSIASLLRVYFILILTSYCLIFFYDRKKILIVSLLLSSVYFAFSILILKSTPVSIFLGSLSTMSTPNFSRASNWMEFPLMTLESLLYTCAFSIVVLELLRKKFYGKLIIYIYVFIFAGSILSGVSQNRILSDAHYVNSGSVLNDDMSRKKIPFIPLYLCSFFLFFNVRKCNYSPVSH
ncbi:hypothetical protein U2G71_003478 [Vibrio vulnificus]|nr:hypothetical protein [Vibrio vulnificus]EMA2414148.1 hypothetical protein [Vibrio vulnificus]MCU8102705.1 hypothetical protein [Vibrio vulnificus]HAS8312852.1 hypothetical protein [Vibrio vulnificus]